MSSRFDLDKRREKVAFVLEKKAVAQPPTMRVGLAIDLSGSMQPHYASGVVQTTLERLLAVAMRFDDDGRLDAWAFQRGFARLAAATAENFSGYVEREILADDRVAKWGGTSYGPVLADMVEAYAGAAAAEGQGGFLGRFFGRRGAPPALSVPVPSLALFATDGANDDREAAARVLRAAQAHPIYWQMVGIGDIREFGFIRAMADELPNVGFVHLPRLDVTDEALYEALLSDELCAWVRAVPSTVGQRALSGG